MSELHTLKTDSEVFQAVMDERKNFEIRRDDRDFKVGDRVELRETEFTGEEMNLGEPLAYTGRTLGATINYILRGPIYGLSAGWCILDIADV